MPRGPAPKPHARRRNKPTIATNELPASGRKGRPPAVPKPYTFKKGSPARAFWDWAWKLPQATKWDEGSRWFVARRASLEDDLAAIESSDDLIERIHNSIIRIIETDDPDDVSERLTYLGLLVAKLKSLGAGKVGLMKEMRELDNRLGLNPKALLDLRWTITDTAGEPAASKKSATKPKRSGKKPKRGKGAPVAKLDDYRDRLG